ncbi:phosphodiester glycosidase family protein [Flavobacterium subsaxonicum]|uniref:phosphodiester glycosidase family protein n=1 Tax=Flavobacterium subsaxonicum TaxID=426226 RepID=UPI001F5FE212|nr:phosphodiester glycosidase family protein [Flavobacterium subsaxonicum]
MKNFRLYIITFLLALVSGLYAFKASSHISNRFVTYIVDPTAQDLKLYYKNDLQQNFGSLGNLKKWLEKKRLKLQFAMNGGMYKKDTSPQGLYIQEDKTLSVLDTASGSGNFHLKPNGVFYLDTNKKPAIVTTPAFSSKNIKYATQSGPMLLINGKIHKVFKQGSANLQIRNGVGILPGNKVILL